MKSSKFERRVVSAGDILSDFAVLSYLFSDHYAVHPEWFTIMVLIFSFL